MYRSADRKSFEFLVFSFELIEIASAYGPAMIKKQC